MDDYFKRFWDEPSGTLEPRHWLADREQGLSGQDILDHWGPGSPAWEETVKQYDKQLEVAVEYNLGGTLGLGAKQVVINDYLPAGQLYVTEGEIILSKLGWEALLAYLDRQQYVKATVSRIVEREMGDVLAWLREAGHDV